MHTHTHLTELRILYKTNRNILQINKFFLDEDGSGFEPAIFWVAVCSSNHWATEGCLRGRTEIDLYIANTTQKMCH